MGKRCIVCAEEAVYKIKDTSDYYCKDCALESFSDLAVLLKVEEEVNRLKEVIKERLEAELAAQSNGFLETTAQSEDTEHQDEQTD